MSGAANKSLKKVVCAVIVTLVLAGCARANFINPNSVVEDGIEYYLQTDKSNYDLGEEVQMLYRVTNLGNEDATFSFPHSPEWNFWVERDGEDIWRAVNGWYMMITVFTLSSGESVEFPTDSQPYIWNMRDNGDNLVHVGEYNVIGGLYAGTGEYDSTRVSVSIEIVPEPTSIALLGVGIVGIIFKKQRDKQKFSARSEVK